MSNNNNPVVYREKNMGIAYLLWFFLGPLGSHRFYIGENKSAIWMLVLFLVGSFTFALGVGIIVLLILGIWWFTDVYFTYKLIDQHNKKIKEQVSEITAKNQTKDSMDGIEKLHELYEKGAIDKETYDKKKEELLKSL